VSPTAIN
jgi:hypothetical protein